ncbi:MAG: PEP-CTERM sorting domain-containing protein [Desulfatitalea sp.]
MKRILAITIISSLLTLFLVAHGFCTTLRWEFTGRVTGTDIPLETLSVGDEFTGFFSYSFETNPTNQTPGAGVATYTPDHNLNIEYGVYFDDFSTSGTGAWMWMPNEAFPAVPETVWGLNSFQGNPELSYIEDLVLTPGSLLILTGKSSMPMLHIHGQFGSFESKSQPVPEPASIFLLGTGIVGLFGLRKRCKNRNPIPN